MLRSRVCLAWSHRALPVFVVFVAAGCTGSKEELPKTYAAHGKALKKDGTPFKGGMVTFQSVTDNELRAYGKIADDGTFTLNTLAVTRSARTENLGGAAEGEFVVSIESPIGARPVTLKKKYQIKPSDDNEITVMAEGIEPKAPPPQPMAP